MAKKRPFQKPESVTRWYERDLRKVSREVGRIIDGFIDHSTKQIKGGMGGVSVLQRSLAAYAEILKPWAALKGEEMARQTNRLDRQAWEKASAELSKGIRETIHNTQVGREMRDIVARQVVYITSLPVEAGQRVQKLVIENMADSRRADEIAEELMRSGEVTESRAMLIARTETTRAATALTQARAQAIGSQGYIWRTAGDGDVRQSHKEMEGKFVKWSHPPTFTEGKNKKTTMVGHAGALPNCRCYCEPVIPDL